MVNLKKSDIEEIHEKILSCKNTYLWEGYINQLNIISQKLWTRPTHYILELLQNAEDACRESGKENGEFKINVSTKRIKITHNGKPFTNEDLKCLCNVKSNKKPEKGTIGYLGIGFKSVFKITDAPEIYSGDYWFIV